MIIYKNANEQIERIMEFLVYACSANSISLLLPFLFYTLMKYYILDSGKESFFLFFPTWFVSALKYELNCLLTVFYWCLWERVPFDWETPYGYLAAWLAQSAGLAGLTITALTSFNIAFESSWLFIVIAQDITNDLDTFNNTVKTIKNCNGCAELMEHLCHIIQHYTDAKQFQIANSTRFIRFDHILFIFQVC